MKVISRERINCEEQFELETLLFLDDYQNREYVDYFQYIENNEIKYSEKVHKENNEKRRK